MPITTIFTRQEPYTATSASARNTPTASSVVEVFAQQACSTAKRALSIPEKLDDISSVKGLDIAQKSAEQLKSQAYAPLLKIAVPAATPGASPERARRETHSDWIALTKKQNIDLEADAADSHKNELSQCAKMAETKRIADAHAGYLKVERMSNSSAQARYAIQVPGSLINIAV